MVVLLAATRNWHSEMHAKFLQPIYGVVFDANRSLRPRQGCAHHGAKFNIVSDRHPTHYPRCHSSTLHEPVSYAVVATAHDRLTT